jgi:protein TonB
MMSSLARLQPDAPRLSPGQLVGVVLVHAGLLGVLLNTQPRLAEPVIPPRPLMVSLIEPATEVPQPKPEPKPQPPKPVIKPLPPPPVLTAQRPVPTPDPQAVVETPKPLPEPVPEVLPPPAPAVVEATKPASSAAPPSPPRPADYLANPKPPYPSLSKRLREEGTVRLNILVNPDGSVARLELAKSSGYPRLDQSAMNTVQSSWKFEPGRQGGNPVAAWVIVPIQFTLRS